jgi:hypothetical protein
MSRVPHILSKSFFSELPMAEAGCVERYATGVVTDYRRNCRSNLLHDPS